MYKSMGYRFCSNVDQIHVVLYVKADAEYTEDQFDILACEMLEEHVKNPKDFFIDDCWDMVEF